MSRVGHGIGVDCHSCTAALALRHVRFDPYPRNFSLPGIWYFVFPTRDTRDLAFRVSYTRYQGPGISCFLHEIPGTWCQVVFTAVVVGGNVAALFFLFFSIIQNIHLMRRRR